MIKCLGVGGKVEEYGLDAKRRVLPTCIPPLPEEGRF